MKPEPDALTDVSRYERKQEGDELHAYPRFELRSGRASYARLRDQAFDHGFGWGGALGERFHWTRYSGTPTRISVEPRPAVHTAAGSFFLRGRP